MDSTRQAHVERPHSSLNGYALLIVGLALPLLAAYVFYLQFDPFHGFRLAGAFEALLLLVAGILVLTGLYTLQPNEAVNFLLFGAYSGSDRVAGLRWVNPFLTKQKFSLRARNLNGDKLKVNDKRGNPIEIAAVVVWRVEDVAKAAFDIDNYEAYVRLQSETAVRHLAASYPYDEGDALAGEEITLRGCMDQIGAALMRELGDRLAKAGVAVDEARLTHLAYAPEIAQVMLRRQQAEAVIAARQKIVTGAVTMVEMALKGLSEKEVVELDDERRATMVSNLMVVLCAESDVQPVINTGTLYA
jgi:regulator of protease activity HflC (stomatin/prohibitin superfamily)